MCVSESVHACVCICVHARVREYVPVRACGASVYACMRPERVLRVPTYQRKHLNVENYNFHLSSVIETLRNDNDGH